MTSPEVLGSGYADTLQVLLDGAGRARVAVR
jgi:hypothetical protein